MTRFSFTHAWRSRPLAVAVAAALSLSLVVSCASNQANRSEAGLARRAAPNTSTQPAVASTATTLAGPPEPPPPATGHRVEQLTFVDNTRPTVSAGRTIAMSRTLPVTVYLPTEADGSLRAGPLPWILFLHGFNDAPPTYEPLLLSWVTAGYIVAAPTFPLTSSQSGPELDEADMVNEPADVTFLLTSLLTHAGQAGNDLTGHLDAGRIGIAGHSDGANVAFVSGYSTAYGDRRIRAVADLAGELPVGMGPFNTTSSAAPLLMIHADHDEFVPYANSEELFGGLCCHKWWIELAGTSHLPPFAGVEPWADIVETASVAFWNRFLGGYSMPAGAIVAAASKPPWSSVQSVD